MKNDRIIDALEACRQILIDELEKYVESQPGKEVKCNIYLPIYADDTYNLDGYWSQNTVTRLFIDNKTGLLMAEYEDYDEQFCDSLDECFITGEIAKIVDSL